MGNEIKITEIKKDPTMLESEHKEQNRKQHIPPDVPEMEVNDISVQDDSVVNNEMKVDDVSIQDDSAVDNESSHILYEYSSNNEKPDHETNYYNLQKATALGNLTNQQEINQTDSCW